LLNDWDGVIADIYRVFSPLGFTEGAILR